MTKLEELRRKAGMTSAELSQKSGVSAPTIIKIEGGRVDTVIVKVLFKLADALGCEAGILL